MTQQISISEFRSWMNDPVTKAVMKGLTQVQDYTNTSLSDPDFLLGSQLQVARAIGIKEALQLMLDIGYEDLGETDEVDASRT